MSDNQVYLPTRAGNWQDFPDLFDFLRDAPSKASLPSPLNRALAVRDFQLGDELYQYNTANDPQNNVRSEHNSPNLYLICQGRVRLLGFDRVRGKEVSTVVLEAGESFGTERDFAEIPTLTRAIAASDGQIAQIEGEHLQLLLAQLPPLRERLQEKARLRQRLVFFKTATDWRHQPAKQLQPLLPILEERQIPAGERLIQSAPSAHFWLRCGQIGKGECLDAAAEGESWGYPQSVPEDWSAQTDLWVYRLPKEQWDALAPDATPSPNGHQSPQGKPIPVPVAARKAESPAPDSQPHPVVFPQPRQRHRWGRRLWRGYPCVEQQSATDCGAACLATIGQYWGKRFSLNALRNLTGVGRAGASLKNLATAAENLGFRASPVRASLSRLVDRTSPWIAHWEGEHYIVVYQIKGDRILIADPAVGKRWLSRQEFLSSWTGYALLLEPTAQLVDTEADTLSFSRFWGLLGSYRSLIGQIILASVLIQVFGLITPLFTQIILDRVVVNQSFVTLHVFAIGLILFGVWRVGLVAVRQYLLDYLSNRIDITLISGFISHALRLPLTFFQSRHVGDIITRVQENQKIQLFLTRQAVTAWLDALLAVVYIGLMAYYNWRLTLLVVALIPPFAILALVATPFLRKVSREIFKEEASENSALVEMISGVATIKTVAVEQELRWQWEDRLTQSVNARFRGQKLANNLQASGGLINTLGTTALLWYGASLVIQNQLTIGQFVAFNMLIGNVIDPVLALVQLWDELQEVLVSVERLNDVFSTKPEENPRQPMMALPALQGEVQFDQVTFRYDGEAEHNTLENISFEARSGQTIAIVGRSGSGKSTLASLLQGLYHPISGRIYVDGHDIRHISPQSLRSQLGVVPQECYLFSGTILENITLHRAGFGLEQAIAVAKLAEAHAFIQALPLGYNTKVGERGCHLSGGQRQRIAIARALLGNPKILILDEATSSLDTESERRFQRNLTQIGRDRTTFIIAHRLSTVCNADLILVLDRGILAECGTHEELFAHQGLYYHLAQQQLDL